MNILLTNFHPHEGNGHDTYIKSLIKNKKHKIYVACPPSSSLYKSLYEHKFLNLLPLDFPGKLGESLSIARSIVRLASYLKEYEIDIVHTNGSPDNRLALYVRVLFLRKFTLILTKHNSFPISGIISRWRFFHANDAIIAVSQSVLNGLKKQNIINNVCVIRNGVDTVYWQRFDQKKQAASSKIVLSSIAGTANYKGWHYLINALKLLPEGIKSRFEVKIAGRIPDNITLSRLCDNDALPDQVFFVGYFSEPQAVLKGADIGFVLSDAVETISFACREMMSMGLPVIVSEFGGLPENVTDGVDGWIVPTGNIVALASLLNRISQMSSDEIKEMKNHARKKAVDEFGISRMIEETNNVYNQFCS